MTKESLLMQYQSECRNALESAVNISKSFQKVFMDAMKLFIYLYLFFRAATNYQT